MPGDPCERVTSICSELKQVFGRSDLTAPHNVGENTVTQRMTALGHRSLYCDVTSLKTEEVLHELEKVTEICCFIKKI